jgi:hypothetical protein
VDKKKRKKKKVTATKATGSGDPTTADTTVKSTNEDAFEDKITRDVATLDDNVKMIFKQSESVMVFAKSGFEMAKHDHEVLQNQHLMIRDELIAT